MLVQIITMLILGLLSSQAFAEEVSPLETTKDKVSYSIGMDIGMNLKRQAIDINADALAAGLKDSLTGSDTQLTTEEMQKMLMKFQQELQAKARERANELGEKNKKEGEAFLAENKKKKGVVTLPSGLQYKIITAAEGKSPKATDTVTTNYRGTLIDGTVFDSSYDRGEPATFPVNGVIKGWQEALPLMTVGSKWELVVPSDLAYGARGPGGAIGPNATLIFEVELLSIVESDEAASQ